MIIDDQPALKITDLRARARRMKETQGVGLLIIDYLQLILDPAQTGQLKTGKTRFEISGMLKHLAR